MAQTKIGSFTTTGSGPSIGSFQNDNFQINNTSFTSVARGPNTSYFQNAHDFQIVDSTFTNIQYSPRVGYIVKGPLRRGILQLGNYFIVGSCQEGMPGERVDIVRRFDCEEDRDTFEGRLKRSRWAGQLSMQPLWKINIGGHPCLVVSSAPAVYTLQEMLGGKFPSDEVQENMYIKLIAFFQQQSEVYPGQWDSYKLWKGEGKYENLRLFDQSGNFIVNPEELKVLGLLYEDREEFQEHGDVNFNNKVIEYHCTWDEWGREDKLNHLTMMHIKSEEVDLTILEGNRQKY
ncbi:hypothetical protein GYMLUDRAFT_48025 [Collybiopsis luxurians FD-317 M1]|uniref:Uncharacterized protein n=1 Tax=Collybiopsis luxurians FD-317 M1 TaxID=944289 RepID=A0A0D0BK58_9AGAR|nr:hypothetical protein GYMLUDRAFT_48025 [Collybiopsis luxurians FD-317 M1]